MNTTRRIVPITHTRKAAIKLCGVRRAQTGQLDERSWQEIDGANHSMPLLPHSEPMMVKSLTHYRPTQSGAQAMLFGRLATEPALRPVSSCLLEAAAASSEYNNKRLHCWIYVGIRDCR